MSSNIASPSLENENASGSGSESKKRNRLGYHRTSVACGHCRHRKIRCIPSEDQSVSQCQNCIRLKKECQFYPVEGSGSNSGKPKSEPRVEQPLSQRPESQDPPSAEVVASARQKPYGLGFMADSTVSNVVWQNAPESVASPTSVLRSEHQHEQPTWLDNSVHGHMQNVHHPQHNQSPSIPSNPYWFPSDPSATIYQQQQQQHSSHAGVSAPQMHDPHLQYSRPGIEPWHDAVRRSFSSMPAPELAPSSGTYQIFSTTFPESQRSMTMPELQVQTSHNTAHIGMQMSAHSGPEHGQGQHMHNTSFPSNAHLYSPPHAHQAFNSHYLPLQQDRRSNFPDWPG